MLIDSYCYGAVDADDNDDDDDDDGDDDDDDNDDGENNYYFYNYSTNIFNKNERFNVVALPKRLQWNFNFLTHLHWIM